MTNSVSKEYANVLVELGLDYQFVLHELRLFTEVLKDKEIAKFFKSPVISDDEKKRLIKESLKLEDSDFLYFLYVLVDNKRIDIIDNIYIDYSGIIDDKLNIGKFTVYTSKKLNDDVQKKIMITLQIKYKKKIVLDVVVDENLIGGIVIKYKNEIIDDSVIGKLNDLKNSLLNN